MLTAAYSASTGQALWTRRLSIVQGAAEGAEAVGATRDGSKVIVVGSRTGSLQGGDFWIVAYDATTGAKLWSSHYTSGWTANAVALAFSPDYGTVYVTGTRNDLGVGGDASHNDYATAAYDIATGVQEWDAHFNSTANDDDHGAAIGVSTDGSTVFVTGASEGSGTGFDYATVAYNASNGHTIWIRRYNGPASGNDSATGLVVTHENRVVITGMSDAVGGAQAATVAYAGADGSLLWVRRNGFAVNSPPAVTANPNGLEVFVTTETKPGSSYDYGTFAYSAASGQPVWSNTYAGPSGDDVPHAIAASADGSRVFVTGSSLGNGTDTDEATAAYDAYSGHQLWVRRNDGPSHSADVANAIAVSPDNSKVSIAGTITAPTTGIDAGVTTYASG
jgi:hypothetical protein